MRLSAAGDGYRARMTRSPRFIAVSVALAASALLPASAAALPSDPPVVALSPAEGDTVALTP